MRSSTLHLLATGTWLLMTVPTLLWWHDSVLWVGLMSVYAIVVSHAAAYEAARSKETNAAGETPAPRAPRDVAEERPPC